MSAKKLVDEISDIGLETLCQQLGVPARIFSGEVTYSLSQKAEQWDRARIAKLRECMTTRIVTPMLEKNFPELFWELAFTFSRCGKVYKRREKPIEVTWQD